MVKKILCVIVLMLALVCVLTSCGCDHEWTTQTCEEGVYCTKCGEIQLMYGYGHTFGEWTTITERTCTQTGIKERVCACGEKETQTLPSGHNFADWGICLDCSYGWVNIELPKTPLTVNYLGGTSFKISDLRYELGRYDSGYLFRLFYSGEFTYQKSSTWNTIGFTVKLLDSEGYVVFSDSNLVFNLNKGDKLKDKKFDYKYVQLDPNETYTLVITDYD